MILLNCCSIDGVRKATPIIIIAVIPDATSVVNLPMKVKTKIASNMLNADFPILIHNGIAEIKYDIELNRPDIFTKEIQDKGCIHNTINKIIKDNFISQTKPHITLQITIHFRTLQEIVTPRIYSTKDIQFIKFNIDTITKFGTDLASEKGWDILESSTNCITGICKFKLANRKK